MEYNQQLCEERHKNLSVDLAIIAKKLSLIESTLNGNGKTGMSAKVDALWHWYQRQTATRSGLLDWAFRIGITIILGYIATKVGLK